MTPDPQVLLVDHPVLGLTLPEQQAGSQHRPVPLAKLSRRQRLQLVAQLTACTALLAELDLWPGQSALRGASCHDTEQGLQARLHRLPVSLSRLYRRLGGGEEALRRTSSAVVAATCQAAGIDSGTLRLGSDPGFFLEPWLQRVLGELPRPLDPATARSLWMVRWKMPPQPDEGEVVFWSVPPEATALRLAVAMLSSLQRAGRPAWLSRATGADGEAVILPPAEAAGALVMVGRPSPGELAAAEDWAGRPGCSAVVLGRFPEGWDPPRPPLLDGDKLSRHLMLTGAPLDRCLKEVERRQGRFDPLSPANRQQLSRAAAYLFDEPPLGDRRQHDSEPLARLLGLSPRGLPEELLVAHSGLRPAALRTRLGRLGAIVAEGRWRLSDCGPLRRDPLHGEIAGLYPEGDPHRLRHQALAGSDPEALLAWARQQLEELRHDAVRAVLSEIGPGELGEQVQQVLAEACLAELDLTGAREALAILPERAAAPWQRWLEVVDPVSTEIVPELPDDEMISDAPRAAAEIALKVLRLAISQGLGDETAARRTVSRCLERLGGAAQRWYLLEHAGLQSPSPIEDREWCRRTVGGHDRLRQRLLFTLAHRLWTQGKQGNGKEQRAQRLLRHLVRRITSPGMRGLMQLDLASLAAGQGEIGAAKLHDLRAYRLLSAAGFRFRIRDVLFNLAVSDLDRLRVVRAERRFRAAAEPSDPFLRVELCRLALAVGDEQRFRQLLETILASELGREPRFSEAVALLEGVATLLRGDLDTAAGMLAGGGSEGELWLQLVTALAGDAGAALQESGQRSAVTGEDGWGVALAARLLAGSRQLAGAAPPELPDPGRLTPGQALALVLVERCGGRQAWFTPMLRRAAVEVLQDNGLHGWSRWLRQRRGAGEQALSAMARLQESGSLLALDPVETSALLELLGLGGLEVSTAVDGRVLWRVGEGEPGPVVHRGQLILVPLGGEPGSEAAWRLLAAVLEGLPTGAADRADAEGDTAGFLGVSAAARRVRDELRLLAPSKVSVAFLGETGVGKDVAAQALHRLSGRSGRLVAFNVAAVPSTLLEAELFGSVKGAFTGADRARRGLVESADGGTLFLDEIGDLDLLLQVKLLRFLETQEVRPVGADRSRPVDVRIITATHRDLAQRVREGSFRQDLYYRVAQAPITIPPLRERREDIPLLRARFAEDIVVRDRIAQVRWSREADEQLLRYQWPGNVRELRSVVEVAMIRAAGGVVQPEHLPIETGGVLPSGTWDEAMLDFRRRFLTEALRRNDGNRSATARQLGISRQTLLYHIRALGLHNVRG